MRGGADREVTRVEEAEQEEPKEEICSNPDLLFLLLPAGALQLPAHPC